MDGCTTPGFRVPYVGLAMMWVVSFIRGQGFAYHVGPRFVLLGALYHTKKPGVVKTEMKLKLQYVNNSTVFVFDEQHR